MANRRSRNTSTDRSQPTQTGDLVGGPSQIGGHFEQNPPGSAMQVAFRQSPYPPAHEAELYERLHPGAFGRILTMAETAQSAQVEATEREQRFAQKDTARGHWMGMSVTVLAMVGAAYCAYLGQPWVAGVFLGVPVLSVARSLIETSWKSGRSG